jgi:hypothetical protein
MMMMILHHMQHGRQDNHATNHVRPWLARPSKYQQKAGLPALGATTESELPSRPAELYCGQPERPHTPRMHADATARSLISIQAHNSRESARYIEREITYRAYMLTVTRKRALRKHESTKEHKNTEQAGYDDDDDTPWC